MATFILIPGGWQGGWAFEKVADLLNAHGHNAQPLTLAALGDVPAPSANLALHITEAVRAIRAHHDKLVLVGHSYGGMVANARFPPRLNDVEPAKARQQQGIPVNSQKI